MVETNLVEAGYQRLDADLTISQGTRNILHSLQTEVSNTVSMAIDALITENQTTAQAVIDAKPHINRLANEADAHLSQRLIVDEPKRIIAFHLESEIIEHLKRMYYYAKRIAKLVEKDE